MPDFVITAAAIALPFATMAALAYGAWFLLVRVPEYRPGDEVEVDYDGESLPGKIASPRFEDRYLVLFRDGRRLALTPGQFTKARRGRRNVPA